MNHLSIVEGDGRGGERGFLQDRIGTTNVGRNNPNNESELQLGCKRHK
jgi:hypothetical protein